MVYVLKIKYTWTQHTQKTENNAIRKRPAISNNVETKSVTDVCVCGGGGGGGGGTAVSSYKLRQFLSKEKQYKRVELVLTITSSSFLSLSEVRHTHMCLHFNHS